MDESLVVGLGEFLDERSLDLAARAIPSVRPIYGATHGGAIDAIGTAVLVCRARTRFLATAKHLLEHNQDTDRDEGTSLYVGMPDGEINENLIETTAAAAKDPSDLALLPCEFLQDYPANLFLDVDSDFVDDRADFTYYHVIGYRIARRAVNLHEAMRTVRPKPFLYTGTRLIQDQNPGQVHIRIDAMKARHGDQRWETGPLEGISGGGVFPFFPLAQSSPPLRLAGILIEHRERDRRLVATKTSILKSLFP